MAFAADFSSLLLILLRLFLIWDGGFLLLFNRLI
jgi:hypothetical protein